MIIRPLWVGMLFALIVAPLALAATGGAPALSSETTAAAGPLSAAQQQEVAAFVKYHAARLTAATADAKAVVDSRTRIQDAYTSAAGAGFKTALASSAVSNLLPPSLASQNLFAQINGVLAVCSLREEPILPALANLAGHTNAAVRYAALKTYRDMRGVIFRGPQSMRNSMFQVLTARANQETSLPAIGMILQVLNILPIGDLANVDPVALAAAQNSARPVLAAVAGKHLQALRNASPGIASVYEEAVRAASALYSTSGQSPNSGLALLADIMVNAGAAYLDGWTTYTSGGGKDSNWQPAGMDVLLRASEAAMRSMVSNDENSVTAGMAKPLAERGPAVKLAVNKWVGTASSPGILNAAPFNVKAPQELSVTQTAAR